MDIFVTFDYELFFGNKIGSAENCILAPTNKLIKLAEKYNARFTFFVDVLYLMKLSEYSFVTELNKDFTSVVIQLKELINHGHDIQLHLHTHWINAVYENGWKLDYDNYRIHNFSEEEIDKIVRTSIIFLENITGQKVFAFRAGGWCLQPFSRLKSAFLKHGIKLDSTVFYKGYNQSPTNLYDFRTSPDLDVWNFNNDPVKPEPNGEFTELPISSCFVSPLFFFKMVMQKKLFPQKHKNAGNGKGITNTKIQLLRLLFTPTYTAVSCDGYKSSMLEKIYNRYASSGKNNFVIIGHPKLLSAYALDKLENLLSKAAKQGHQFLGIQDTFGAKAISQYVF